MSWLNSVTVLEAGLGVLGLLVCLGFLESGC